MQAKFIALNGFIVCLYRNYRQSILKLAQNIKPTISGDIFQYTLHSFPIMHFIYKHNAPP